MTVTFAHGLPSGPLCQGQNMQGQGLGLGEVKCRGLWGTQAIWNVPLNAAACRTGLWSGMLPGSSLCPQGLALRLEDAPGTDLAAGPRLP